MKKIRLYTATSIDGYTARNDGDLDWLMEFPNPEKKDYGYQAFFESVDTIVMNEDAYLNILSMDILWPYKDKPVYVIANHPINTKDNIYIITEDAIEEINKLREEEGKDIWAVGDGKLVAMLLDHDIVDEMTITCIPVILGDGIPLFPDNPKESIWSIKNNINYQNGVTQVTYEK